MALLPPHMPTRITVMADSDGSPQRDDRHAPPPVPLPLPRLLPGVDGGDPRGARGAEAGGYDPHKWPHESTLFCPYL